MASATSVNPLMTRLSIVDQVKEAGRRHNRLPTFACSCML
jgi:hypothetical protein